MAFKNLTCLLLILLSCTNPTNLIALDYFTFCVGACYNCPNNPFQCPYVQSLIYPPANHNCLPYSTGNNCAESTFGYQVVADTALDGWTGAPNSADRK